MIHIPTGHRELASGEYIAEGDLYFSYLHSEWVPVVHVRNDKNRIKYNPASRSARHARPIIRATEVRLPMEVRG